MSQNPGFTLRTKAQNLLANLDRIQRRTGFWFRSLGLFREKNPDRNLFSVSPAGSNPLYAGEISRGSAGLTGGELAKFRTEGWAGPFPFLTQRGSDQAEKIYRRIYRKFKSPERGDLQKPGAFSERPWSKSMHAYVPEFYDLAAHPAVTDKVADILGPDLMVWSLTLNLYRPGERHRWHVDIEHKKWKGVTVFLGLRNITERSTLKVISRSHRMGSMPQELGIDEDGSALAACRSVEKEALLTAIPLREGEFFIFDGLLWHGSRNETFRTRGAMIIQYSRPDQPIALPMNTTPPVQWHPTPPPCVLVKGEDRWGVNRLVPRPGSPGGNRPF